MHENILIVEDDLELLDSLGTSLKEDKYNILIAYEADLALEILLKEKVDLLITDVEMPDCDSFYLVENVRKIIKYRKLPIILMSGEKFKEAVIRKEQYGIKEILKKPVKGAQLKEVAERLLRKTNKKKIISKEVHEREILGKLSVLVVDDEENLRQMLKEYLETLVKFVTTAGSFEEAKVSMENHSIDIVITDVQMQDCTGFELAEWINELPEAAGMPVIMMSGVRRDISSIKRAKRLWIDKYIAKPFDLKTINSILLEVGTKNYRRKKLINFRNYIAEQEMGDRKEEEIISSGQRKKLFQLKKDSNILAKKINRYSQDSGSIELFELIEQKSKQDSFMNRAQEELSGAKKMFFERRKLSAMIKRRNMQRLEGLKD